MNLGKINKLVWLCVFTLLIWSCDLTNQAVPLCTDSLIDDVVKNESSEVQDVWNKLRKKRIVTGGGKDLDTRVSFVGMQFTIESVINGMLKSGIAEQVTVVIYTPMPSTPLRMNDKNIGELIDSKISSNAKVIDTIVSRHEVLEEYLKNKGVLYSVYQSSDDPEQIVGMNDYLEKVKAHDNLIDTPVQNINPNFIGATYMIHCSNGQDVFFAIRSNQANNIQDVDWQLLYGSPFEHKIAPYVNAVQDAYKELGINFSD